MNKSTWRGGTGGPPTWPDDYKTDHPASRPGTGEQVVWRGQVHAVSPSMRCNVCGWYQDTFTHGPCYCGGTNWIRTIRRSRAKAADSTGASVDTEDGLRGGGSYKDPLVIDYQRSRLNELLGGIKHGAILMLAGAAGAGKSTSAAELAAAASDYWSSPERGALAQPESRVYWLDSDQRDGSLVRECFRVAGAEEVFVRRARLLPENTTYTFDTALALLPRSARTLVIDSLERWGSTDSERLAVLDKLRSHPAWLKIVIAGTNKLGVVSGMAALERANDATVFAEQTSDGRYALRFTKRRWKPCEAVNTRIARVWAPNEPMLGDQAASFAAWPDFRPDALDAAMRWSIEERSAFASKLRKAGTPEQTIQDWFLLVDTRIRALGFDLVDWNVSERDEERKDASSPLPSYMEAPYAALLRSWPWTEGVRVSAILDAWPSHPGQDDFYDALADLSSTAGGELPNAHALGNALRRVRGYRRAGMMLTSERIPATKIALWRVVRDGAAVNANG